MARAFNFSAGPAVLPEPVLEQARAEMLEWRGEQASVIEVSHRGKAFVAMAEEAERDLRALMSIPDDYRVLFLQGGATQHFAQIPMNIAKGRTADYVVTGAWGEKAAKEAASLAQVRIAATSEADGYFSIPPRASWDLDPEAAYVHITPNETIGGVEFAETPDTGDVPLVADMSSNILSRPLDVSRYGIIYAGAQKNIGPSGLVILIIRDDLLTRAPKDLPSIFRYAAQAKEGSMLNTPNTFAWYLAGLVFKWIAAEGGVEAMATRNAAKASLLYDYIDASGWYSNPVERNARSRMNIPFRLADASLDDVFVKQATAAGLLALKGHRSVGGMRASMYNAMPLAGVEALVGFMRDFAARHG
jgi:phosphoserine aminotransferase